MQCTFCGASYDISKDEASLCGLLSILPSLPAIIATTFPLASMS